MNYILKSDIVYKSTMDVITIPDGSECITKEYFEESDTRYCKIEWLEPVIDEVEQ